MNNKKQNIIGIKITLTTSVKLALLIIFSWHLCYQLLLRIFYKTFIYQRLQVPIPAGV